MLGDPLFITNSVKAFIKPNTLGTVGSLSLELTEPFEIDCVLNETQGHDSVVTKNPIEDGSYVVDHITKLPQKLMIEGLLTDTPTDAILTTDALLFAYPGRSIELAEKLEALDKSKLRMTVVTGLKVYQNMVFESLTLSRGGQSGRAVRFTANLSELVVATTSDVLSGGTLLTDVQAGLEYTTNLRRFAGLISTIPFQYALSRQIQ